MSIFGITALDVKKKLVPFTSGDSTFDIGAGKDMTEEECLSVVATQEDRVLSMLPERYRRLMTRVEGEVAVKSAAGGQTSCVAGLTPIVAGSLKVYKNFPRSKAWVDRAEVDELAAEEFTVDLNDGEIVFATALMEGDVIELEYDHEAAAGMAWLKECVVAYAAVEVSRRFDYFANSDGAGRMEAWESTTTGYLRDMNRMTGPGIALIDGLKLRGETRGKKLSQVLGL